MSEFKLVLAEYDDSGSEDEEDAEFVPVIASFQISRFLEACMTTFLPNDIYSPGKLKMFYVHSIFKPNFPMCCRCT